MACSSIYVVVVCCCLCFFNAEPIRAKLKVAVYKPPHLRSPDYDSTNVSEKSNLDYYSKAAQLAKFLNADMVIFHEYGLNPPANRTQLKEYLEYKPDPRPVRINVCKDPDNYSHRPMLYTLSCIALNNSIVVMANTGFVQDCTGEGYCPRIGFIHFNTNVVFDRDGTMLLKEGILFKANRGYSPPTTSFRSKYKLSVTVT